MCGAGPPPGKTLAWIRLYVPPVSSFDAKIKDYVVIENARLDFLLSNKNQSFPFPSYDFIVSIFVYLISVYSYSITKRR
jgi:hypothetical protein